ncbi:hypothetical protein PIROE2DRAFT_18939, partial [Piromyces sp. E2]
IDYENDNFLKNIISENVTKFDISFNIIENEKNYSIAVEYNSKIYDRYIIESIINSYIQVLSEITKFEKNINEIECIPENEKQKILYEFNCNWCEYECDKLYHVEFSKVAKQNENKCALVCNDIHLTYKQLDEMSNSLAHYLRKQGIGRNDIIPIICERSPYYIVGTLAISKAGGAFLPIDNKLPIDRIKFIIKEVNAKLILYFNTVHIINKLNDININVFNLKDHNYNIDKKSINIINNIDDICYVLFTSGTTGKPKDNVKNILAITNFTFDISHNEITLSLINGLTIILADDKMNENISILSEYIIKNNVDFINTTPTRFKLFMENEKFKKILYLIKVLVFIGEELPMSLCKKIHKYSNCKIYNGYGPTECTVTCTYKEINEEKDNKILIGGAQCNYSLYILDKYLKPVPIGVEGEIFIGGYGVGKGYLNHKKLTNEKFIKNPYNNNNINNKIIYRTGDLGKWTKEGEIDYLGRIDFQIKINGQRIELGEIESIIKEIHAIKHTIVIDKIKENGEKYLICYYVVDKEKENKISKNEIRNYLKRKLPLYMVPNYYKKIEKVPLSSSGKLNRKALPEINIEDLIKEQYVSPETEIEKSICKIYSKVFHINESEIGRMSSFFELGGDSMNAIRIISFIENEFNIKINIKDILTNSLIRDLGIYIESLLNSKDRNNKLEKITRRNLKEFPITSHQLGVYIDSIKNPNSTIYNIPILFKLKGDVDINNIKKAFSNLIQNQEILKSKYIAKEVNGSDIIYGYIEEDCQLHFENYTYENSHLFVRPFNLSIAPLIRVGFINEEVLLIDIHHIISDGSSISIIMNEINRYLNYFDISKLEIQFSDFALYLNEKKNKNHHEKEIQYYKEMFNCDYDILNIPKINYKNNFAIKNNKYRNENGNIKTNLNNYINQKENNSCGHYIENINNSLSEKINKYIINKEISKTAFFITIYGYVMSKYSSQDVIYSSIVSANRNSHYTENMIGMFVSTQPLLLKYDENTTMNDTIFKNMEMLLKIYENNILNMNTSKKENQRIYLEFKNEDYNIITRISDNISKFDISFNIIENEKNYSIAVEYNSKIYDRYIIESIINSYIQVLSEITKFEKNINEIEYIPENEKQKYYMNLIVAKQNENKCALVCNDIHLTYKQLDEMSNSLAHYLRKQGIGRNDIIPIICERSYHFVVGVL